MTELLSRVEAPSDAELISRVRGGDVAAYGELFARHVDAAQRLGRQLVRGPDVDDLVSEAFARTLQVLRSGGGPDVAFRAYLLTSLRRLHVDRIRATQRVQPTEDMTVYDDGLPFHDTAVAGFESGAAAKAFASLPERWQLVLWHLEVEGQKPADVAPLLGMTPNSVSALAYRAREGLRQAFLTMHLADSPTEECRWTNERLGAYVRGGLSKRDTAKVEKHLDECRRCMAMYLELSEVNSNLAGLLAPLVLGAAATGYLSSSGAGVAGISVLFGRARDFVSSNSGAVLGGAVAAGVAAVATTAFVLGGQPDDVITDADHRLPGVQTSSPETDAKPGEPGRERRAPGGRSDADRSGGATATAGGTADDVATPRAAPPPLPPVAAAPVDAAPPNEAPPHSAGDSLSDGPADRAPGDDRGGTSRANLPAPQPPPERELPLQKQPPSEKDPDEGPGEKPDEKPGDKTRDEPSKEPGEAPGEGETTKEPTDPLPAPTIALDRADCDNRRALCTVRVEVTGDDDPQFTLVIVQGGPSNDRVPTIKSVARTGPHHHDVTVHMPPHQGTFVVRIRLGTDGPSSESFTVGSDRVSGPGSARH